MESTIEPVRTATLDDGLPVKRLHTLGSVRHRDAHTNEIILIPAPSDDPNDPLNWSKSRKYYMAGLICFAMFTCNLLAAGPTIAIVATTLDFFPNAMKTGLTAAISTVAYFFTTTALLQGLGNLIWMPIANKYGRRPVYIISYALYTATAIWLCFEQSYGGFLAGRILMGFAAGAAETLAPVSIADVFFLHERGAVMAMYTAALSCGVGGGIIIDGLIVKSQPWRVIYYVATGIIGALWILVIFTFPETAYNRVPAIIAHQDGADSKAEVRTFENQLGAAEANGSIPQRKTFLQEMKLFNGTYTQESLMTLFIRPIALVVLPPVLWGSLVMSVTIGFLVAVTSNVASAFSNAYGFEPYQTGLCFFSSIIGSLIGVLAGGHLGDMSADWLTKRNGGLREPEMRLPAILISLITTPLALVLYGAGIQYDLHWMCPTIGLGLLNFSIVQATNISLVYTMDCYRPITGEVTVTQIALKSAFGFLLSFYTNPWIEQTSYLDAYGAMAGIAAAILLLGFPLYFFGKTIRQVTWHWRAVQFVHWEDDREVGE